MSRLPSWTGGWSVEHDRLTSAGRCPTPRVRAYPFLAAAVPPSWLRLHDDRPSAAPLPQHADPYPEEPFVAAAPARDFGDTLGVNVRFSWNDTVYGNYDALEARLLDLGARHVLDGLCAACPYQVACSSGLPQRASRRMSAWETCAAGALTCRRSSRHVTSCRAVVSAVVAPNEPDLEPVTDWVSKTRACQVELWNRVKGDPALAHLPVFGPSLVHRGSRGALGDLSAYLNYGNLHPYPGGIMPLSNFDDERQMMSLVSGNKPLVITEVGYHADTTTDDSHRGVSEAVNASYTPRLLLEAYRDGIKRTFFYQFVDPFTEAQRIQKGLSKAEGTFGLLRNDLTPRPSYIALRNLMDAVDGDSAPVGSPGGIKLGFEGAPSDMRRLLLRSADGSYALVLWRQVSLWDRVGKRPVTAAPVPVDVVMGERLSLARRFDPVVTSSETARWNDPRRISVSLAGAPVVLRLTPASATPPEPGSGPGLRAPRAGATARLEAGPRPPRGLSSDAHAAAGRPVVPRARSKARRARRAQASSGRARVRFRPLSRRTCSATWRPYARTAGRSEGGPPVKRRSPANSKNPSG